MENWRIYAKKADFNSLSQKYDIDPVIARIIRNRDVVTDSEYEMYLSEDMSRLHNPWLLKDMNKAIDIIMKKITDKERIRVIGDYDIDGICSIYILVTAIERAGGIVDYVVPDRVKDGYGINENIVKRAYDDGIDTLITCDNGIAAVNQIAYAKELGMTVVVTDHHDIPFVMEDDKKVFVIPQADAVINPKQEDCEYPFKNICGAFVAYKLAQCLLEKYDMKEFISELIEFAAIATIGDIMELKDENRILVKNGLAKLRCSKNTGIKALIEVCGVDGDNITSYDIGFRIGPCLNASGRLDTAKQAVELLMTEDKGRAMILANTLKAMNEERKNLTEQGKQKAVELAEEMNENNVLVIYLPECHESIAGIIAGRVKERFNKPTIVLTDAHDEGVKGSGRSIEAYNMFEELTKCKDLFTKFGGHKMAAGLSLPKSNVETLRQKLNHNSTLTENDLVKMVWIDVPMPIEYISEKLIKELKLLEPFGNGNEKPIFADKNLFVKSMNIIGKNKNVAKLRVVSERGYMMDALYFGEIDEFTQYVHTGNKYSFTYYPGINEYNGVKNTQIVITGYK